MSSIVYSLYNLYNCYYFATKAYKVIQEPIVHKAIIKVARIIVNKINDTNNKIVKYRKMF